MSIIGMVLGYLTGNWKTLLWKASTFAGAWLVHRGVCSSSDWTVVVQSLQTIGGALLAIWPIVHNMIEWYLKQKAAKPAPQTPAAPAK